MNENIFNFLISSLCIMWIPKHLEFKHLNIKVYEIYKSLDTAVLYTGI